MGQTIYFAGSRAELYALINRLPSILAGKVSDPYSTVQGLQLRLGVALLSKVEQAFILKSRGGVGEDGIKWKPLDPKTIAQRRTTAGERKALGITGKRVRGLLTPTQDKQWRAIFASSKARLMAKFGMSAQAAASKAAAQAWAILKSQGAKTKLAVLGNRQVDMCRDTSRYFRSLSPGIEDRPSGADGQIFDAKPGQTIVGTNVAYAGRQHAMRPLWPAAANLPSIWWEYLLATYQIGLVRMLVLMLSRA